MNYSSAREPNSNAATDPFPRRRALRVLIADDEALPAEMLKRSVIRLGHTVVGSAQNGLEAIAQVRATQPDVVVMDLRMPVMDGWTAMAELAREMLCPVVVVSALDDRESLAQAVQAGASAFLTKPVREDELERALALAVARFSDLQEIRKWRSAAEQRARDQVLQTFSLEQALSELREAQLQLVNAARRAAVASLAHGLAHEINNALTPIIGNAQIIGILYERDPDLVQRANQIIEHAQRIAGWTASFRQVTMGGTRSSIQFSFNGILRDVLGLYADRFQRVGIQLSLDTDNALPVMEGHPDQIQEVLMNLIQNTVEALRQGGTLEISTRHDATAGTVVTVLRDSGPGIPVDQLPLVFEPGFTTKETREQSVPLGWGLFTVKQIVQAHGGSVRISSPAEGSAGGTAVYVTLPLTAPPPK